MNPSLLVGGSQPQVTENANNHIQSTFISRRTDAEVYPEHTRRIEVLPRPAYDVFDVVALRSLGFYAKWKSARNRALDAMVDDLQDEVSNELQEYLATRPGLLQRLAHLFHLENNA